MEELSYLFVNISDARTVNALVAKVTPLSCFIFTVDYYITRFDPPPLPPRRCPPRAIHKACFG